MSNLSPENEAFRHELVAKREFADRDAVLDEAVGLLRRRHDVLKSVDAGVRIRDSDVEIARVLHGSRDLNSLLG